MVEAEHQNCSMVERKLLQRRPQSLVIDVVIDRFRPRNWTHDTGAPLSGGAAGTVTATVQHHAAEVRAGLVEFVPPAINLDERVMDEIARVITIAGEERSATDLPGEFRVVEHCEPVTAVVWYRNVNEVRPSRPRTPRDRDHHPLPRLGTSN
jgi:hypothetical protein